MDPASFVESIEDARQTELGRLGSSKLLIALTGANLEAETVLRTVAARVRAARETFEMWVADEDVEAAREVFEAAATVLAEAGEGIASELDGGDLDGDELRGGDETLDGDESRSGDGFQSTAEPYGGELRGFSDAVERAGGLVGWTLVVDRVYAQVVGFFVNEAAPARADLFREVRDEVGAVREDAVELLAAVCDSDDDWERASGAAESVVRAAYDDYASTLDEMGLDPKPVC